MTDPNEPQNMKRKPPPLPPQEEDIVKYNRIMTKRAPLGTRINDEMRTFMLYGFLAETGLNPSEAVLVQSKDDDGRQCFFWSDIKTVNSHNEALRKANNKIHELEQELLELHRKK
jgi:hypothetical protein